MDYEANKHLFVLDGKRITTGLFEETIDRGTTKWKAPFKLSDWKKVYLEACDPTEYRPAMELIGDWAHWKLLRESVRIKPIIDEWAMEVEVRIRSEALINMQKHAKKDGGTSAAKWIAEGGFTGRDNRRKEHKEIETRVQKEVTDRVNADAERLGLTLVVGGKSET